MDKFIGMLLKGLLITAGVLACLMVLSFGVIYLSVRPQELPLSAARQFIELEPGDAVLHAYTGLRWLDSQRYFVVKAEPGGFDARIKKLSDPDPKISGMPADWEARVTEGPGKELYYRGESVPAWWDVETLPSAVAVDVTSKRHNHIGSLRIFSKERGLIYIVDR